MVTEAMDMTVYCETVPEGYRNSWCVCELKLDTYIDDEGDEICDWRGPIIEIGDVEYLMDKYKGRTDIIFTMTHVKIEDE